MRAYFLILSYLTLVIANTCDRLTPVYKSFECAFLDTKYDCGQSPYVKEYVNGSCYFRGSYYEDGNALPIEYPGFEDTDICKYTCHAEGSERPYFDNIHCDHATPDPKYSDGCIHDLLYNVDYLNEHRGPVFVHGRRCPLLWARSPPPGVDSDADCIANSQNCCQFGTKYFSVNTELELSPIINCTCSCPPLVECNLSCVV